MKKLKPKFLVYGMVLMLVAMVPIAALTGATPNGKPFQEIWEEIEEIEEQIEGQQENLSDLQEQINAEIAARIAGDEALQANIDAEEAARIAADNDLQNQIDNHEHAGEDITSGTIANARLNMGHGNGLNADMVDGKHASELECKWSESGGNLYYNDGNVGIGTASPTEKLDVEGNVHASGSFIAGSTTNYGDGYIDLSPGTNLDIDSGTLYIDGFNDRVGIGTTNPGAKLDVHVTGGAIATIGHSDNSATGQFAMAFGFKTTASGWGAVAIGRLTIAKGHYSTAMGLSTTAYGDGSTAMGYKTNASGPYSTAMGENTLAGGWHSTAMGYETNASYHYSTAMGFRTTASEYASIAMGSYTTASGAYATAMGYDTTASGLISTAIGREIEAQGDYSVAIALSDQNGLQVTQDNTMAIMGGNVGIGTVNPNSKLDVSGTVRITNPSDSNDFLLISSGDSSTSLNHAKDGGTVGSVSIDWTGRLSAESILSWYSITTEWGDVIVKQGDVGIGTVSPTQKLHVAGNVRISGAIYDSNNQAGASGQILMSTGTGIDWVDPSTSISDGDWTISGSDMYSAVSGKVGIGTTSPNHKLEVVSSGNGLRVGNANSWFEIWTGGNSRLSLGDGDGNEAGFIAGGENTAGENVLYIAGSDDAGNCPIYTTFHQSGKVGIGTTSPAYTLDVEGDIQAHAYHTGDIFFQKDGKELWRMFEDEDGLYLENLESGKVYQFMMKEVKK